ncbi:hypothetical protein [Psychrobacter sp.]|uniref:hypothetical protein n=1 Tax=Psychrobacter sp. TaxID=56811 RepID=UPI003F97C270
MKYTVTKQHWGDRQYFEGDTREVKNDSDAKELMRMGMLEDPKEAEAAKKTAEAKAKADEEAAEAKKKAAADAEKETKAAPKPKNKAEKEPANKAE